VEEIEKKVKALEAGDTVRNLGGGFRPSPGLFPAVTGEGVRVYCSADAALFVPQGINGIKERGLPGGIKTEEDPDNPGNEERQDDGAG